MLSGYATVLNARSLFSKVDELPVFLDVNSIEISVIIETWYDNEISDDHMSIEGFTVHRRDRVYGRGRGVCFNASNVIYSKRLADLENADHECMWIWSRPNRLPRPLSGLAV